MDTESVNLARLVLEYLEIKQVWDQEVRANSVSIQTQLKLEELSPKLTQLAQSIIAQRKNQLLVNEAQLHE